MSTGEKAQALGVSLSDINETISAALGGYYVNDFIDRGRVKKVYVRADAHFRMLPSDINNMYVRSANGEMVPFSAFVTSRWIYGSPRLNATTVYPPWKSSVKPRRVKVPGSHGADGSAGQ